MARAQLVIALIFAVALSSFGVPAKAHSPGAETLQSAGNGAFALFRQTEGCTRTEVMVFGGETLLGAKSEGNRVPFALVLMDIRDICSNGGLLVFGDGFQQAGVDYTLAPRLTAATLHATVPVDDLVSNTTIDVRVDVTWTGTGALDRTADQFSFDDDGFTVVAHSISSFRNATPTGSVTAGATTFVPAGSTGIGSLSRFNDGQIIIFSHEP